MPNKIVVTNPIHDEVRQRLAQYGEVIMNPLLEPWHPSELAEHLSTHINVHVRLVSQVDIVSSLLTTVNYYHHAAIMQLVQINQKSIRIFVFVGLDTLVRIVKT